MNITLDQYLDGFEKSMAVLPKLLNEWYTIDQELQQEYSEQLAWLIRKDVCLEVLKMSADQNRMHEVATRVHNAFVSVEHLKGEVEEKMGVRFDADTE